MDDNVIAVINFIAPFSLKSKSGSPFLYPMLKLQICNLVTLPPLQIGNDPKDFFNSVVHKKNKKTLFRSP